MYKSWYLCIHHPISIINRVSSRQRIASTSDGGKRRKTINMRKSQELTPRNHHALLNRQFIDIAAVIKAIFGQRP